MQIYMLCMCIKFEFRELFILKELVVLGFKAISKKTFIFMHDLAHEMGAGH